MVLGIVFLALRPVLRTLYAHANKGNNPHVLQIFFGPLTNFVNAAHYVYMET